MVRPVLLGLDQIWKKGQVVRTRSLSAYDMSRSSVRRRLRSPFFLPSSRLKRRCQSSLLTPGVIVARESHSESSEATNCFSLNEAARMSMRRV